MKMKMSVSALTMMHRLVTLLLIFGVGVNGTPKAIEQQVTEIETEIEIEEGADPTDGLPVDLPVDLPAPAPVDLPVDAPALSDTALLLESGQTEVFLEGNQVDLEAMGMGKNDQYFRYFQMKGAVDIGVWMSDFQEACPYALITASREEPLGIALSKNEENTNFVKCVNTVAYSNRCNLPVDWNGRTRYYCIYTTVTVEGPNSDTLIEIYNATVRDERFRRVLINDYFIESRNWEILKESSSPTPQPQRQPTRSPVRPPTRRPTNPTRRPTHKPTRRPTKRPVRPPTRPPTNPTRRPTKRPTRRPTSRPTNKVPTDEPTFRMQGAVAKDVNELEFQEECPYALITASRQEPLSKNDNNINYVKCVDTKAYVDRCNLPIDPITNLPDDRYYCVHTTVIVEGPNSETLIPIYKDTVRDERFRRVLTDDYNIESRNWEILEDDDGKVQCENLENECLNGNKKARCKDYLKRNDCAICNNDNRDKKGTCYPKTGKIYKKAGGYCKLCPKSTPLCKSKPTDKYCKQVYKMCSKEKKLGRCREFLTINKCAYRASKKAGQAFTKGKGYCGVCNVSCTVTSIQKR